MRFLVDNALSPSFARALQEAGHEVYHVKDLGLRDAPDSVVFETARTKDLALISLDTDFGAILASQRSSKPSLILFRGEDKRTASLLSLLLQSLPRITESLEQGAVVVFDDRRIRIRSLPIF
ncbi:MAG: hypothetical protein A2V67_11425 [Deltaproteobacteria bacterium RBG_13_61_14]|nr:MAG: hypothetical protein A2V67_11425 [Deltaproteobacteria bacterium RBG_13_61_14]